MIVWNNTYFFQVLVDTASMLSLLPYCKTLMSKDGTNRKDIYPGLEVGIILKKDQRSGKITYGFVKDILTSSPVHSRGIKVRLDDGQIGRVAEIPEEEK
jgi:uncharacterized repeat protein (TIGR03833 family)